VSVQKIANHLQNGQVFTPHQCSYVTQYCDRCPYQPVPALHRLPKMERMQMG
jgi:hypothetical protein